MEVQAIADLARPPLQQTPICLHDALKISTSPSHAPCQAGKPVHECRLDLRGRARCACRAGPGSLLGRLEARLLLDVYLGEECVGDGFRVRERQQVV